MKKIIVLASLFLAISCSNKDKQFCECLSVGDELNTEAAKYSSVALDELTDKDVEKLRELKEKKDSICAPYEMMSGPEMLKKKEACK
ncbi:MAG: hypothetical protein M9916_01265 [Crocinitomicaceae bacterium]|nr:hypothetical protein [Crocinitomicaceae bacterium]